MGDRGQALFSGELSKLFSAENPVFSGGFGLAVLAVGAQLLRSGSTVGLRLLRQNLLVTMEVTSKDRAYPWVLRWISSHNARTRHLSVETSVASSSGSGSNVRFSLVPGPGQHFLHYRGSILWVQRIREQQMVDLNSGKPWEKVLFTAFGRNPSVFSAILDDAYALSALQEENKTVIFTNWGAEWRQFGQPRRKRSLDSVVLDEGVAERIVMDVFEWQQSSKWYSDRGIPYRRGYLLHGPPGSGKSSFIYALAGKLDMNICVLNLSERGLTDDRLALALSTIPANSIVLLEDVDAAFPSRTDRATGSHTGSEVTFSGLLNVLDGVAASEDRLVFMTTNHIEKLDPALIRPGRVDYVQLVGDATDYQIRQLLQRFYPEISSETGTAFVAALRAVAPTISMAAMQGYLLRHKGDSQAARANLPSLLTHVAAASKEEEAPNHTLSKGTVRPRPVRRLTVEEVDRMFFQPQEGWDKNL